MGRIFRAKLPRHKNSNRRMRKAIKRGDRSRYDRLRAHQKYRQYRRS